ncbi:helix-turn-helix domain-containing protein [bacterium]|nr:helix-turn-helix domain-containing protein [bacterium]MBU1073219.1 helix-turn-helix domain-containing protein [bacterium]MBU1674306.1 helix-turn-helix domain-containing protein [bacterium]
MRSDYPEILTLQQAAELLQVSERTIQRMVKRGKMPGSQIGGQWRFDREQVKALVRGEWAPEPKPLTQSELIEKESRKLGVDRPETLIELQRQARKRLEQERDD